MMIVRPTVGKKECDSAENPKPWGRLHQYEKYDFIALEDEVGVLCRVCTYSLIPNGWRTQTGTVGYRCTVCKMDKYALCDGCYQKATTKGDLDSLLVGCRGDGSEEEQAEEELKILKKMQLEDSDLALEQLPKSFVPSSEAIGEYANVSPPTGTQAWMRKHRITKLNKQPLSYWLQGEKSNAASVLVSPPLNPTTFEFPTDESLLLHIMSWLYPRDLCRAACVSKVWYRVAMDNSLWKVLSLKRWPTLNPDIKFKKWAGFYRSRHKAIAPLEQQNAKQSSRIHAPARSVHVIDNCRWIFKCPLTWESLNGYGRVKHCDACNENVHYCDSIEDIQKHAEQGSCIAIGGIGYPSGVLGKPAPIFT
eukprot:TRINITY_DN358_c0_g2_i1.p1 TRINITY_DN358_c0_g2~~TRINITY_DN358_c0_g2_i1.p1  ORF type:complete len:363 (-),score=52.48 TRINITY_DN358_c0_g2_i1:111-1199(-)